MHVDSDSSAGSVKPLDESSRTGRQVALLISSCWWAFTARIALRFAALGWRVEAICPAGHPLRATRAVARVYNYSALRPLAALRTGIAAARPELIVPCDDRAVAQLHDLHARQDDADIAAVQVIARSLGRPENYPIAVRRSRLIQIAHEQGLRAADMRAVSTAEELEAAINAFGLPIVLKVDGTWGGLAVQVAQTADEARTMHAGLARRLCAVRTMKRLLVDRDPYSLLPWLTRARPQVNAQRFVCGHPANSVAACHNGEVLASIHVEVLEAQRELGPARIVRVIDHPDMQLATRRLVQRLGLSGFCGFDFMIEASTGHADLVEMNPRSTPLCHLALGPGRDPIAALTAQLEDRPPPVAAAVTDNPVIAYFPQALQFARDSAWLSTSYHDVPWDDPGLIRELTGLPYPDRGMVARFYRSARRSDRERLQRRRLASSKADDSEADLGPHTNAALKAWRP